MTDSQNSPTSPTSPARRRGAAISSLALAGALLLLAGNAADAAIVPTVGLGSAAAFSVLGSTTVTNTLTPTILDNNLGVSPGTAITGFPPGMVVPPSTIHAGDGVASLARADLTSAYIDAAARPVTTSLVTATVAELGGLTLQGGVYAEPAKAPLGLTGTLTLDGANNPNSVFIFQTDSELTTASASAVQLINGAQECNVFWQVGSSATLGTGSVFVGNILALTSISVTSGVTVHGRALARNGAVTLDNDRFIAPTCDLSVVPPPTTTTTTTAPDTTTTTTPEAGTPTTTAPVTPVTPVTPPAPPATPSAPTTPATPATPTPERPDVPGITGPPRTGAPPEAEGALPWWALVLGVAGAATGATVLGRRARGPAPTQR